MILAIDIGNSTIVIGAFEGEELVFMSEISTQKKYTSDQYAVILRDIFSLHNTVPAEMEGGILSSVVPELTATLAGAAQTFGHCKVLIVNPGMKTGLNIRIENPAVLGANFVCSSVVALKKYPLPCIVVELGAATKLSALDAQGYFVGCSIAPGVKISLEALSACTAQLPFISIEPAPRAIGKSTREAMNAGIVLGTAAMLDGMIDRFQAELGGNATVVVTGNYVESILPYCRHTCIIHKTLILDGLRLLYQKNKF